MLTKKELLIILGSFILFLSFHYLNADRETKEHRQEYNRYQKLVN